MDAVLEFTGERVIPGLVNEDLFAEHMARYAFAARFASKARVLEIACGAGYGAASLAKDAAQVTALDISGEAVAAAAGRFAAPNLQYLQASASNLPLAPKHFDLITAFEVIEHLGDWPKLLEEAARVLAPGGVFLVSTPNKLYYSESRAEHGPNPFHTHEFEYQEFVEALAASFSHVEVLLQDRTESFAFYHRTWHAEGHIESGATTPEAANFFLGVCSNAPLASLPAFVYVPRAANLLRERERHIHLLERELAQNKDWLEDRISAHAGLQAEHEAQTKHLEEQNRWAARLEEELQVAQLRIATLQVDYARLELEAQAAITRLEEKVRELEALAVETHEGYRAQIHAMAAEDRAKTLHMQGLEGQLAAESAQLDRTRQVLSQSESLVEERTRWAQGLDAELEALRARIAEAEMSPCLRVGRQIGVGPIL